MDSTATEASAASTDELAAVGAVLVEEPTLRRIIKAQLGTTSAGLRVPHHHCFVASNELVRRVARIDTRTLPEHVIVVTGERDGVARKDAEALRHAWRLIFHSRIHAAFDALALDSASAGERIDEIGQTEFDEVRSVLRQEHLLVPPGDDLAAYGEFVALYSELRAFAPHTIEHTFPAITDLARVDAIIARDIDVGALLAASRPASAPSRPTPDDAIPEPSASLSLSTKARIDRAAGTARKGATSARARGNLARAAILSARAGDDTSARLHLDLLVGRLGTALGLEPQATAGWSQALVPVAEFAGTQESLRFNTGTRLLADLQAACIVAERDVKVADFVSWALTLGRRKLVRDLPVTREVRMARRLHKASGKVPACELEDASDRARLADVLHAITARADANVRSSLRPKVEAALDAVGLEPHSLPERVAQKKLVDELLDRAVEVGRLTIGDLRDSISKNDLKLPDLSLEQLRTGDQLLRADRILESSLDGVYRSGEAYLRVLQKLSSIAFGTKIGRFLTRFAVLPLLGAFAVVEGLQHMIGPLAKAIWGVHPHIATRATLYGGAGLLFLIMHVRPVRTALVFVLRRLLQGVRLLLFDIPLAIWRLPLVRRALDSRLNRWLIRPAIPAAIVAFAIVTHGRWRWPIAAATFAAFALLSNSPFGRLLEERAADWVILGSRQLTTRFLPGLVRYVLELFGKLVDYVDRGMYFIDEQLRFRSGQSFIKVVAKGVLSALWFIVAYVLRLYVDLFIEPTTNPIKHFPVVTVAAKLLIPFTPAILTGLAGPLSSLVGPTMGKSFAAFTVIVIPGFAGFLVWELKENWKLYKATRGTTLAPLVIGHHGETMVGFLKPGFHSGTIPKLYMKVRRASWHGDLEGIAKQHDGLHHVEIAIERFVDRQLVSMLVEVDGFRAKDISLVRVELGSNRVQITVAAPSLGPDNAVLRFELQSGWIVASIAEPGWTSTLDPQQQQIFEIALAGFYKLSGVSLVREQLERALRDGDKSPPYDISDDGLVVWPIGHTTEIVYDLHATKIAARTRGAPYVGPTVDLAGRHALFGREPLYWSVWATTWQQIQRGNEPMRIIAGPSLLPHSLRA